MISLPQFWHFGGVGVGDRGIGRDSGLVVYHGDFDDGGYGCVGYDVSDTDGGYGFDSDGVDNVCVDSDGVDNDGVDNDGVDSDDEIITCLVLSPHCNNITITV